MGELKLLLNRKYKKDSYTIGLLYANGKFLYNTMEDRDRGLTFNMPLSKIATTKVYGETAIPRGVYRIEMTYSPKFAGRSWASKDMGKTPQLMNVPGFAGIRIHPLNIAADSLGCIGVGDNTVKGKITNSTARYRDLVDNYIKPALQRGDKVTIEII